MSRRSPFAERLLAWWDIHGRKNLPWQHPRTPYRAWISEIMLQQTQVSTVTPYFENFMRRFPDLPSLAAAPLDEVLALWAGLGYYARGRNLHKAARECVRTFGGQLPSTAAQLANLPGIGESTAHAIVSQAHDIPAPVLDGNVRRVLARHAAIDGWSGQATVRQSLQALAEQRLPATRGADYTQAIMDLGATVCTRSNPRCDTCPVSADCQARIRGRVAELPARRPRIQVREIQLHLLVMTRDDQAVWLEKRPPAGIWGGLWCLPGAQTQDELLVRFGVPRRDCAALPPRDHRLTHRLMHSHPWRVRAEPATRGVECNAGQQWFEATKWRDLGLPKPILDILSDLKRSTE